MSFQVNLHNAARWLWLIALDVARATDHPLGTDHTVFALYDMALQAVQWRASHIPDKGPYKVPSGTKGAYANGYQATMFDFYKDKGDKGIAYLKAEGPPQIVRTVHAMDKVEADKVALRARAARQRADRLTGYAAGEELEAEEQEVLLVEEIRSLFGTANNTMHLGDIAAGLAARRPGTWGSLDAKGLGALLRGLTPPIEPTTVYVAAKPTAERSGKGLKREQLDEDTVAEPGDDDPGSTVR